MMLYTSLFLVAALGLLCGFSGLLWRSRAKEQQATVQAVIDGANAVGLERSAHADYVFTMKEEAAAALARKDAEITLLGSRVQEVIGLLKFSDEMVSSLRLQLAEQRGANAALSTHFKETGDRLVAIESGHNWHLGGAVKAHDGSKHHLYECDCGVKLAGPEGFIRLGVTV